MQAQARGMGIGVGTTGVCDKIHSLCVSLGHETQQQKLQSSPRIGVFKAYVRTCFLIRRSVFSDTDRVHGIGIGTKYRTPEINTSEIIVDLFGGFLQLIFSGVFQRIFICKYIPNYCHFPSAVLHSRIVVVE